MVLKFFGKKLTTTSDHLELIGDVITFKIVIYEAKFGEKFNLNLQRVAMAIGNYGDVWRKQ